MPESLCQALSVYDLTYPKKHFSKCFLDFFFPKIQKQSYVFQRPEHVVNVCTNFWGLSIISSLKVAASFIVGRLTSKQTTTGLRELEKYLHLIHCSSTASPIKRFIGRQQAGEREENADWLLQEAHIFCLTINENEVLFLTTCFFYTDWKSIYRLRQLDYSHRYKELQGRSYCHVIRLKFSIPRTYVKLGSSVCFGSTPQLKQSNHFLKTLSWKNYSASAQHPGQTFSERL